MELLPAVDIRAGRAVRLTEGDFARQTDYGDPLALAVRWAAAGASWVHVVDLDGARRGEPVNTETVRAITAAVAARVQVGGGLRRTEAAEALFAAGVDRVVMGTLAVTEPAAVAALAAAHPGAVAVGLDHRGGGADVAVSGWEAPSGRRLEEVLAAYDGVPLGAVVVTSIERDGTLAGPDLDGLAAVLARCSHPVVASGGVRSAADLAELAALAVDGRRLAGVIVGKALADGRLSVEEALAACAPSA